MGFWNSRYAEMGWLYILFFSFVSLMGAHGFPQQQLLRFRQDGQFKILQVADMHYANGAITKCKDVLPEEYGGCSDLNTTAFIDRLIAEEKPDLVVFTGDNIFGKDTFNPRLSMDAAFAPAKKAQIPWAAILGNHDQESTLSRLQVMEYITKMEYTVSRVYPSRNGGKAGDAGMTEVDGFGNYHLGIRGALGSPFENQSILNLYFLDSGDYSKLPKTHGYGWIQESQKKWFKDLSRQLKDDLGKLSMNMTAPALVYFHIPLVETRKIRSWCRSSGVKQEDVGCAEVNSGFLEAMWEAGGPHLVFNGHDHVNDFCGDLVEGVVRMCYGGGAGYHAYGRAGWRRRARIVSAALTCPAMEAGEKDAAAPPWLEVEQVVTWKRLDHDPLPLDFEILWSRLPPSPSPSSGAGWAASAIAVLLVYLLLCCMLSSWRPFPLAAPSAPTRYRHAACKPHAHGLSKCMQ